MMEYYPIDLPGKNLYEVNFNIKIRKVTPLEIKYVSDLFSKQHFEVKEYVAFLRKLVEFDNPEMTFEKLYWYDLQYILYNIRFKTFSKFPMKIKQVCSDCGKEFTQQIDIGSLTINEPSDIEGFSRTLQLDNLGEVKVHNKLVGDDLKIENFLESHRMDKEDWNNITFIAVLCAIEGQYSLEELYKFAEDGTLTAEDMILIEDWIEKNIWGVKEEILVKCPKCGKEETKAYAVSLVDYFSVHRS